MCNRNKRSALWDPSQFFRTFFTKVRKKSLWMIFKPSSNAPSQYFKIFLIPYDWNRALIHCAILPFSPRPMHLLRQALFFVPQPTAGSKEFFAVTSTVKPSGCTNTTWSNSCHPANTADSSFPKKHRLSLEESYKNLCLVAPTEAIGTSMILCVTII